MTSRGFPAATPDSVRLPVATPLDGCDSFSQPSPQATVESQLPAHASYGDGLATFPNISRAISERWPRLSRVLGYFILKNARH